MKAKIAVIAVTVALAVTGLGLLSLEHKLPPEFITIVVLLVVARVAITLLPSHTS